MRQRKSRGFAQVQNHVGKEADPSQTASLTGAFREAHALIMQQHDNKN